MISVVTLLVILSQFTCGLNNNARDCPPNTETVVNGKLCRCNSSGAWEQDYCQYVKRSQPCQPGQITWHGCNQCICQEDGQLICSRIDCAEDKQHVAQKELAAIGPFCSPFRSYYVNCTICVCPASGKTSEVHCALDPSCNSRILPSSNDFLRTVNRNVCIPKVMYMFTCLQCLCTDEGYFSLNKCVDTCQNSEKVQQVSRCIPKTMFRKDCNVCLCPASGVPDESLCSKSDCKTAHKSRWRSSLRTEDGICNPNKFMKPWYFYCDCNQDGTTNENSCIELSYLKSEDLKFNINVESCGPGEMVPLCIECLCFPNSTTSAKYCSKSCKYESKFKILETVVKNSPNLINKSTLKRSTDTNRCEPNFIYSHKGSYCLCPNSGKVDRKLCTPIPVDNATRKPPSPSVRRNVINLNATCTPSTFVEFDCNTCFCSKSGRIDPEWCTYDDCDAKRLIQQQQQSQLPPMIQILTDTCIPGTISKEKCNFCICPDSGITRERACTKNDCSEIKESSDSLQNDLICEPQTYYEVDCNICYCPRDGIKNVAKCSQNACEKSFLRSDSCAAGQLFSDDCNVCVCPPNGDKDGKVCTNHTCSDVLAPWKKIFKLSQSLLSNQLGDERTRHLDLCFPGEEFVSGCDLCVCPEMGMRMYATCSNMLCNDEGERKQISNEPTETIIAQVHLRKAGANCYEYNVTNKPERQSCTPGSMYIIRCRQCICPYLGNINYFCRPLPKNFYCEQAAPGFNYLPMGRRSKDFNITSVHKNATHTITRLYLEHDHSAPYSCHRPGKVEDKCYSCQCEKGQLIIEHCFKNNATNCNNAKMSFLDDKNKVVI